VIDDYVAQVTSARHDWITAKEGRIAALVLSVGEQCRKAITDEDVIRVSRMAFDAFVLLVKDDLR
jgi:hypothetical protein